MHCEQTSDTVNILGLVSLLRIFTMSGGHNDEAQFKRGLLRKSPSSSSRVHRRRRSVLSDNKQSEIRDSASPHTPAPTVREVINTEQSATLEFETPPARATPEDNKIPVFNELGVGRGGSEVSPGVFYGSAAGKPAQQPPQITRLLNEIQNDLASLSTPSAREATWETFRRQDQALQFADSHEDQKLVVFQYQDHVTGQRRFLSTTYNEFWRRTLHARDTAFVFRSSYSSKISLNQGRPCHLYFDLEFNRLANTEANGEAMVDSLLSITSLTLFDIFGIHYDPSWTLELDSSTAEKFSRHLIIHIPGAAFKDNSHAGAFVDEICKRSNDLSEADDEIGKMFVLQGESRAAHQTQIFVDVGVYSRNRGFRLPFSSKAGKSSLLLPTYRFRSSKLSEREVFLDSLICNVKKGCQRLLTFGTKGGIVDFDTWRTDRVGNSRKGWSSKYGKSPFPALEDFIEAIARIGDVQGKIRSWYYFADYGVVLYNISGNRFCENIGRPHKSNSVMYIVDFRTAGYYQKCHDPDCRGYKSPLRPIPRHTIPPEFPLSTAGAVAINETLKAEELDSQDAPECDEWEDEAWWGEVISTVDNIECLSQRSSQRSLFSNQSQDLISPEDAHSSTFEENREQSIPSIKHDDSTWEEDDDWWDAVELEAIQLEMNTTIRKLPSWSP